MMNIRMMESGQRILSNPETREYLEGKPRLHIALTGDVDKIPVHKDEPPKIPICTKPITEDEILSVAEEMRDDPDFMRMPMPPCAYEHFPEFAETKEQLVGINATFAEKIQKAQELKDLDAEKKALKERIQRLKKMAKKNKAIRTARRRIMDIETRKAELEDTADVEINLNS